MTIKQELAIVRRIWRWFERLPSCSTDFLIDREMCKRLARGESIRLANVVVYRKEQE